jgi:hypothetical protein
VFWAAPPRRRADTFDFIADERIGRCAEAIHQGVEIHPEAGFGKHPDMGGAQ